MDLADETILCALSDGRFEVQGEFLWGSNYTFLVQLQFEDQVHQAVYKPTRGERPLWDFPIATLGRREAAAYLVSAALGWDLVPPTVYRKKGPLGAGSLQWFIEHDPNYHYFNFSEDDRQRLRPTVLLDILINNADRKGSHILKDPQGRLWLIDHGVCFHVEEKLRTVIWDFVEEPIPPELSRDISRFADDLTRSDGISGDFISRLFESLSPGEVRAMIHRAENIVKSGVFPSPDDFHRPFPWPQI